MLSGFLASLPVLLSRLIMLLCYEFFIFSVVLTWSLFFSASSSLELLAYSDSDWAGPLLSFVLILIQIGRETLPIGVLLPASVFF